jgi:uncharacterized protein
MVNPVMEAAKLRRSQYALGKDLPVPEARIREIVEGAILEAPSSYNSQSARIIMLSGDIHDSLWDFLMGKMQPGMKAMLEGFKAAHGSILFFEDQETVARLQAEHPRNAEVFPVFSLQSSGMLQYAVWTALAHESVGASVQHFVKFTEEWARGKGIAPETWKSISQMVYGGILRPAGEKTRLPLEERLKVLP